LLLSFFVAPALFMFSCKDDDDVKPSAEIPDKFSELSPEEHKGKLEENGLQLVEDFEGVKDLSAISALKHFFALRSLGEEGEFFGARLLNEISALDQNAGSTQIFSALRLREEEPESMKESFEENIGVYIWDFEYEGWVHEATGSAIVYKFPSGPDVEENDAMLTIKDFNTVIQLGPDDEEEEFPTNLVVELKIDNAVVLQYSFNAKYANEGMPTSVKSSLKMSPYQFAVELANDGKKANVDYSLTKDGKTLIALGASAKGVFIGEAGGDEFTDVVHSAQAYFQALNIKIVGIIDVQKLAAELQSATSQEKALAAYNNNIDLAVVYADSNTKLAEIEFYINGEEDIRGRMVFGDESRTDVDVYFQDGFDNLIQEIQDIISEFQGEEA